MSERTHRASRRFWALLVCCIAAAGARATTAVKPKTNVYVNQTWASGTYQYDGAGNIITIGPRSDTSMTDVYRYDGVSRLVEATAHTGTSNNRQTFTYDVYGNVLASTRTETVAGGSTSYPSEWAVDPTTNRLDNLGGCTTGGVPCQYSNYDQAGNALGPDPTNYAWDPLGMMSELRVDPHYDRYLYDANNERVATARASTPGGAIQEWHYTIRGLDNKVERELVDTVTGTTHTFRWEKDYVYRDGTLLASLTPDGTGGEKRVHYHPDHLGTPRLITDDDGVSLAFHTYWPFGQEANGSFAGTDPSSLRFTGHERDFGGTPAQDVDYMHARYYRPNWDRFLSVDPAGYHWASVQSLNRYSYVHNNPVLKVDPDGRAGQIVVGGIIGGYVGLAFSGFSEIKRSLEEPVTWTGSARRVIGGVVGGAISGAAGAACGGCAWQARAAIGIGANVLAGAANRQISGTPQTADAIKRDAIAGAVGFAAGEAAGRVLTKAVGQTTDQLTMRAAALRAEAASQNLGQGADKAANAARSAIQSGVNAASMATGEATSNTAGNVLPMRDLPRNPGDNPRP